MNKKIAIVQKIGSLKYKILGHRPLNKKDVFDYFNLLRHPNKERYCQRCGSTQPTIRYKGFKLCKFCYDFKKSSKIETTPDIEDINRFGIDKDKLFKHNKTKRCSNRCCRNRSNLDYYLIEGAIEKEILLCSNCAKKYYNNLQKVSNVST